MRRIRLTLAHCLLAAVLWAASLGAQEVRQVGLVGPDRDDAAWRWFVAGLRLRLHDLSARSSVRLELLEVSPRERSPAAQAETLASLLLTAPDAVVLAPLEPGALEDARLVMRFQGIPLLTLGRALSKGEAMWHGGIDAAMSWEWLQVIAFDLTTAAGGQVAVWSGGVADPLAVAPDWQRLQLPAQGHWSIVAAEEALGRAAAHIVLDSRFLHESDRLRRWRREGPVVVGSPAPVGLALLEQGRVDALVFPHFPDLGGEAAAVLWQRLRFGPVAGEAEAPEAVARPLIITPDNLPRWKALWQRSER